MNRKHIAFILVLLMLVTTASLSLASGAPTSQFGFSGWPYRQSTSCTMPPTSAPAITPTPTTQPTAVPTPAISPRPTAAPTAKPTAAPTVPSTDDDYTTVSLTAQEQTALKLLNEDRVKNGMSALTADPALCGLARLKSCDMNANNYFAHQSPTLGSASDMLRANGYAFTSVGENIAHHANVEKAQAAFMSSDGHRRNAMGSQWKKIGIGICYDKDGFIYLTQLFVR